jgi:hypothetical protein
MGYVGGVSIHILPDAGKIADELADKRRKKSEVV